MSRMDNTELPHPKEIDNETLLPAAERRVNSQALLGPDGKVIIDHNGQEYLLRKLQTTKHIFPGHPAIAASNDE
ncbi:hemin uptake protein HemP [Salmonella enterica]|uniref:hemin uptake protein HemP n=2 Tax=Salmonella enterica TaxID=28901 RepID=UPI00143EACA1|nr:hemin uptake protein HemP [Salmonella enterica]QIY51995.1 hemin uptake protein HemP [Salmonella enterica]